MMGHSDPQRGLFYQLSLETFVPQEHPLRAIRPLIDDQTIRQACRGLYAPIGAPVSSRGHPRLGGVLNVIVECCCSGVGSR